ncbi:MAG: hypothetical protein J6Q38_05415 [Clostridia bacterium]|nr:hypothetical protein [Clostridia bacterium]
MAIKDEKLFNNQLETEVLFKNRGEELSYEEPQRPLENKGFAEKGTLLEESVEPISPTLEDGGKLKTEILFKSGIEEIEVKEEISLSEESLTFREPIKPDYVSEEVLFKDGEANELLNYSLFDGDDVPSETSSELSTTEDEVQGNGYQLTFGDIQDVTSNLVFSDGLKEANKVKVIKKNFAEKLLEADEVIQKNYSELKNLLLSFKKVKSRISNTADTFNMGRTKLAKLSVSGKSLKLYLNLDFNEVEPRLKCRNSSATKAYEEVPVFLRIRSLRAMKNARYLIGKLAERFELSVNPKAERVDAMKIIKEELE